MSSLDNATECTVVAFSCVHSVAFGRVLREYPVGVRLKCIKYLSISGNFVLVLWEQLSVKKGSIDFWGYRKWKLSLKSTFMMAFGLYMYFPSTIIFPL